jgi:hypothetical protein
LGETPLKKRVNNDNAATIFNRSALD